MSPRCQDGRFWRHGNVMPCHALVGNSLNWITVITACFHMMHSFKRLCPLAWYVLALHIELTE